MDSSPIMNVEAYLAEMQATTESMLREIAGAVNGAPDGAWINGSEMQVRDVLGEYRRRAYEVALQMRTDAAEAAFSPGGQTDEPAPAKQGQ